MPSIFSWMRRKGFERLTVVLVACCFPNSAVLAETAGVRLGRYFKDAAGFPMKDFGSLAGVLQRQNLSVQLFVKDAETCQDLLAIPLGKEYGYDTLRNTYTTIQSIEVECWAVLHFDPATPVTATGSNDRITPDMIQGIMANAQKLSAEDEEWAKALLAFTGGDIACRDEERCRLSLPDGSNPPEQSVDFELVMAKEDERFIRVVQMIYGRSGFVYGVRWRATESGGEVISMFPQLR